MCSRPRYSATPRAQSNCMIISPAQHIHHIRNGNRKNVPHHNQRVGNHIRNPEIQRRHGIALNQILEDQHGDSPSQPSRQQRKSQKQHKLRLPCDAVAAVIPAIRLQPRLFNRVDHQHPQRRADPGDPVDELHVYIRAVARAVRERGRIDQEEES